MAPELATLDYAKPLQHEDELEGLIEAFKKEGVRSYLEIGGRYGGSFERIMMALPLAARGVVVDFPGGPFGDDNSAQILLSTISRMRRFGRDVKCIFGPSASTEVIERASHGAPYDAVVIDADHGYEAVKQDFKIYSGMARMMVVLHDIAAPAGVRSRDGRMVEVPAFWKEIKNNWFHQEIVCPDSLMGYGIIFK